VLVDERAEAASTAWLQAGESARMRPGALPWDVPPPAERACAPGPPAPGPPAPGPPPARIDSAATEAKSEIACARPEQDEEVRIQRRPGG
jgi:hypothetical protein